MEHHFFEHLAFHPFTYDLLYKSETNLSLSKSIGDFTPGNLENMYMHVRDGQ